MKRKTNSERLQRPAQMSKDEIRRINSQRRRRRQKKIKFALYSVLLVCFIGLAVGLSLTVFFNIDKIETSGSSLYSDTDIIAASGINLGDNLFLTDTGAAAEKITGNLPYAGEARIKRKFPVTLIIEVADTREYAAFDSEQGYVLIDEKGKVLSDCATVLREGVAYISGIYPVKARLCETVVFEDSQTLENITRILGAVKNAGLDKISGINLSDAASITLMHDGRILLKAGGTANFEKKMLRASEALKTEEERNPRAEGTLDLTIDPYAYFRAGTASESETPY